MLPHSHLSNRPLSVRHLLCELLSPFSALRTSTQEQLTEDSALWPQIISLASDELVLSALYPALKAKLVSVGQLDPELLEYLSTVTELNIQRNEQLKQQARLLLTGLAAQQIPSLLLKGLALLYSPPPANSEGRMVGDIDILVKSEDVYRAVETIAAQGYSPVAGLWYYDYRGTHHYSPLSSTSQLAVVELHEHLVSRSLSEYIPTESLWHAAEPLAECPGDHYVCSPTHRVLHNILHAQYGESKYFSSRFPLRQLHDFSLLSTFPQIDWAYIEKQFPGRFDRDILFSYLELATDHFNWPYPSSLRRQKVIGRTIYSLIDSKSILAKPLTLLLGACGALSTHRLQSLYGFTRSRLQLWSYRWAHLCYLLTKFARATGRHALTRSLNRGTVEVLTTNALSPALAAAQNATTEDSLPKSRKGSYQLLPLEEVALLVEDDTGVSHILNPFAACIASDILDDRSIEQIASEISTQAEISIEEARADVTQVATLFASTGSPEINDPVETLSPSEVTKLFELGAFFPCHVAQLISQQFRIFVDPRLEGIFKKFATLLETADSTTSLHPPQSILCVLRNNRTIVTSDSGQSLSGEHPEMLPSMLFSIMQRSAAARTNHPLALHGAAFSLNGEATLLLGESGSGKSTLLNAMALRGAEIITDDLILLSDDMRKVYTIALPLGLKEGSWNTDHVSLPVFMHPFGKPIKFLKRHEVSDANHSETLTPISRILFPNFSREAPASSRQLTICETFAEISRAGFFCPGGSYVRRLETLLESLRQTPAHLISYGSTAEAIRLIDEIS